MLCHSPVALLFMDEEDKGMVTKVCVILHNMIVDDEEDNYELTSSHHNVECTIMEPVV